MGRRWRRRALTASWVGGVALLLACVVACGGGLDRPGWPSSTEASTAAPSDPLPAGPSDPSPEQPTARERWARQVEVARAAEKARLERELGEAEAVVDGLKNKLKALEREFRTSASLKTQLAQAQKAVDRLRLALAAVDTWQPQSDPSRMGVGEIVRVSSTVRVFQVVDRFNVIVESGDDLIWIGMPTAGLVDRGDVRVSGLLEYMGPHSYEGLLGRANTVRRFRLHRE